MNDGFAREVPEVGIRCVHLDLKGLPPTFDRLLALLDVFAAARYNAVLVEWEDSFPWTTDPRWRSETAYAPEQIERFGEAAAARGLEIIPLVQCLGHMETVLSLPEYAALRELPDQADGLNPLAPGAADLIKEMINEVLALCPNVRHFHLGGDEAWTFGQHPDTRDFIRRHGKGALYRRHIQPLVDHLSSSGIRPILWHDMMIDWPAAELAVLRPQVDLMVWGYFDDPAEIDRSLPYHLEHIEHLHRQGMRLWCAGGFKGSEGVASDLPNGKRRRANALAWMRLHQTFHFIGAVATGWSRFSTTSSQCEPIDAALDGLAQLGHIFHDGGPIPGGENGVAEWLESIAEKGRFFRCRAALRRLADARQHAWMSIADLHHLVVTMQQDPRRRNGAADRIHLGRLRQHLQRAQTAGAAMRDAFTGLIETTWIDHYLNERIAPIEQQLIVLEKQVNRLRSTKSSVPQPVNA